MSVVSYSRISACFSFTSIKLIIAIVSMLYLTGCGQSSGTPFVTHEFDLEDRQFSIQLPAKASIQSSEDKGLIMIVLQSGKRLSPRITIRKPFSGDSRINTAKTVKLNNSALLSYKTSASKNQEAFLNGHIEFGGRRYVVSCNIQSKYVTIAQAAWCVDYLGTINQR